MSATLAQLKAAYENNNMSPEDIVTDFPDLDIAAVKAGLMQCSAKYRRDCGVEEEDNSGLNFTNDQLRMVNQGIFELAMGADDEHLRLKALTYIRDDKKGRKEIVRAMKGNTFNILQFNEQLKANREMANKIKSRLIEV